MKLEDESSHYCKNENFRIKMNNIIKRLKLKIQVDRISESFMTDKNTIRKICIKNNNELDKILKELV